MAINPEATSPAAMQELADPRSPRRMRRRLRIGDLKPGEVIVRYTLLLVVLLICVGPFLWELSTSLKGSGEDIYSKMPQLLPQQPTLDNYRKVMDTLPVWGYIANSLIVAALSVTGNVLGSTFAGFALARLNFRTRRIVLGLFLATLVLPGEATIIANYVTIKNIGLTDNLLGVALPGMISTLNVLLMYNAFRAIPKEIDEAAMMDGANVWQRFIRVGLPSVKGTVSVIMIFTFIGAWDDFLWPLLVLNDTDKFTLTVGLQYLSGTFANDPRMIAAGAMIAFIPIAILFASLQRYFFQGVGEAGVKG